MNGNICLDEVKRYALMWQEDAKRIYYKLFGEEMPILFFETSVNLPSARNPKIDGYYTSIGGKDIVRLEFHDDVRCFVCHYTLLGLSGVHYHLLDGGYNFPYFLACVSKVKKLCFKLDELSGIDWRFFSFVKPYCVRFHFMSVDWTDNDRRIEYYLSFKFLAFRWECTLGGVYCIDKTWQRIQLLDIKTQDLDSLYHLLPRLISYGRAFLV